MGGATTPVYQDFELCYDIPPDHQLWEFSPLPRKQIATTIKKARLQGHDALHFNDLIVQNYPPGCQGITPHRDHVRYRIVVAIFLLTGDGNFCTCDDRKGVGAKTIPAVPGDLLLMTAPGLVRREARTTALCERGHPQEAYDRASLRRACNDQRGFSKNIAVNCEDRLPPTTTFFLCNCAVGNLKAKSCLLQGFSLSRSSKT